MSAVEKVEEDEGLVHNVARQELQKAGGDMQKAVHTMAARVAKDIRLRTALLDPLIYYACSQVMGRVVRHNRESVWTPPKSFGTPQRLEERKSARVIALAADNILLFPLPGGKLLGDATRVDLTTAQEVYSKQVEDMAHKARWLGLIAQSVEDGKTVRDVLSAARLRELQVEARADAA